MQSGGRGNGGIVVSCTLRRYVDGTSGDVKSVDHVTNRVHIFELFIKDETTEPLN